MATPYCTTAQWAKRRGGFASFAAYTTDRGPSPDEDELQEALEDATNIMNDTEHIHTSTNITTARYLERLEKICYNMSLRILATEKGIDLIGGAWTWSPQDMMYATERAFLLSLSKINNKRRTARVVF